MLCEAVHIAARSIFYEDGHDQVEDPEANQHEHAYIADLSVGTNTSETKVSKMSNRAMKSVGYPPWN